MLVPLQVFVLTIGRQQLPPQKGARREAVNRGRVLPLLVRGRLAAPGRDDHDKRQWFLPPLPSPRAPLEDRVDVGGHLCDDGGDEGRVRLE